MKRFEQKASSPRPSAASCHCYEISTPHPGPLPASRGEGVDSQQGGSSVKMCPRPSPQSEQTGDAPLAVLQACGGEGVGTARAGVKSALRLLNLHWAVFVVIGIASAQPSAGEFPFKVPYEIGTSEFAPGDSITITSLRGTRDVVTTNETYCVEGNYTLASRDKAQLGFHATAANSGPTPTDPRQQVNITKGSGTFRLIKPMRELGYLHVSFYDLSDGNGFGGVYFGQGQWVLQNSFNHPKSLKHQALFDYLGNPVEPPSGLDPAYTKSGLSNTVVLAAQNAGITLKKIEFDDSEFPCLVGVISQPGDFKKLEESIKQLTGEFGGLVGNSRCHAFSIVPSREYPTTAGQRIGRRLGVREEMRMRQAQRVAGPNP